MGEGLPTGISKRQKEASIRKHYERCDRDEVRKALSAAKFGRKQELLRNYGHEVGRISLHLEIRKDGSEQHTWGYGCRRCAKFTKNMRHLKDKRCGGTGERTENLGYKNSREVIWRAVYGQGSEMGEAYKRLLNLTDQEEERVKGHLNGRDQLRGRRSGGGRVKGQPQR